MKWKPLNWIWNFKGEHNDIYNANVLALKCMLVSLLVLFFCWILDVVGVFIVDLQIMSGSLVGAAIVCALACLYAYCIRIDTLRSSYAVMVAMVAMATVICTEITYHATLFILFPLVCSAQYFDKKLSWFTWAISCIGIAVAVLVGYRVGLCDSNMLLLTYTNSAAHMEALTSGNFSINSDLFLMFLFFVFPRWLLMFAMLPLLSHVAKDIQRRAEREATARRLAEIDGLTGLYNRSKYQQALENYYVACDKLAVLFFDINNLKAINDSRGHEYGDILICGLANILHAKESDTCKAYRIGGDEFVMILEKEDAANAADIHYWLDRDIQDRVLEEDVVLSVAIGFAAGTGAEIERLISVADAQMYEMKYEMKAAEP